MARPAKRSLRLSRSPSVTRRRLTQQASSQFGLVAEDVEKVNPDLVVQDQEGKPNSVRYEAGECDVLNEFLKEHRKGRGTTQPKPIADLKSGMTA